MANPCLGKFKLQSSENFDEYMKELGVNFVMRKMGNAATPVVEITEKDGDWNVKTTTTFKTSELKFKLGEQFDETTIDGRNVKTIMSLDGNKLIQQQTGDKSKNELDSTITRDFEGDKFTLTLKAGNVVCTRVYNRCE